MKTNKYYILSAFFYLFIVYSLYAFLDVNTMINLCKEDGLIEYITFLLFLSTSFLFARTFLVNKNIFFLLLSLVFIIGAGEEISWGQRIFSFITPESLEEINVQGEFNIHNIEIFNNHDFDNNLKKGWEKYYTVYYLYKFFWFSFGVILPIIVMFKKEIPLIKRLKLPIPPLSIGLFFLVNWIAVKTVNDFYLRTYDFPLPYVYSSSEVMESGTAFIFFLISYYFFKTEKLN